MTLNFILFLLIVHIIYYFNECDPEECLPTWAYIKYDNNYGWINLYMNKDIYFELDNIYELPWVRLHATKDYYDMVAILDNYPKVKLNINLVPSLLVQLDEYSKGIAKDKFLDLTLKPAFL